MHLLDNKLIQKLSILGLIAVISFFMYYRLGSVMFNADAHFWYQRTFGFMNAIQKGDWADTNQNPKPGVTVMWMSGITIESFLTLYEKIYHFRPQLYTFDTFKYINFVAEFPLATLALIFLITFYLFTKKLLGKPTAFFSLILLGFQPFFIGVSRYFHGDGTLIVFMNLSAITLLLYLCLNRKTIFLILSGIFGGLAFLAKTQAIFLIPFTLLCLFIDNLLTNKKIILQKLIPHLLIWFAFFSLTIFIIYPAMWVKPIQTIQNMLSEGMLVADVGKNGGTGSVSIYFKAIPKISTFLIYLAFPLGIFAVFAKWRKTNFNTNKVFLYIFSFVFFYFLQMCLVFQKSERYLLPLFPFVALFGGYGLNYILENAKIAKYKTTLTLGLFVLSFAIMLYNTPHYTALAEASPWGAVYVDAAEYLNQKPNAVDLKVVASPKEHTFRPFFKGTTYGKGETLPNNTSPDYLVVAGKEYIPEKYNYCIFEHDVVFRSKVYWKIYSCK
ncbi:MAG: glycosyl transferase family protein [uncultured bacterium]|nr:MAG: glycosyl transferase family protein [uncultured bacterium]